jgi:heptosyltransferase-1
LIVRVGAMGDVLHALPALAGLRAALPELEVGWVIEPAWKSLLQAGDGSKELVDRIHLADTRAWKKRPVSLATLAEIAALGQETVAQKYDVCVDLQGSLRSGMIGWLAGATRFVGPEKPREGLARRFYGQRIATTEKNVIAQACELLGAAMRTAIAPASVRIPIDPEAEAWAHKLPERFVLIAPTAGWGAKEWGAVRFAELARALKTCGWQVLVNAQASGPMLISDAVADAGRALIVRSSVAEMIALVRRAALVVGGDTGPVHLAAALGRPVVALFGPTDPERNGPDFPGAHVKVLRDPTSVTSHKRLAETEQGLRSIRVEEVLAESLAMLEGAQGRVDG